MSTIGVIHCFKWYLRFVGSFSREIMCRLTGVDVVTLWSRPEIFVMLSTVISCKIKAYGRVEEVRFLRSWQAKTGTKGKYFAHSWKVTGISTGLAAPGPRCVELTLSLSTCNCGPYDVSSASVRGGTYIAVNEQMSGSTIAGLIRLADNRGPSMWIR